MGSSTAIEWTDHTFNIWRGCEHASLPDGSKHPGCEHCYAEAGAKRNPGTLGEWGPEGKRIMAAHDYKRLPAKWNEAAKAKGVRERVFCLSFGDVFEDWQGPIFDHLGQMVFKMPTGAYLMTPNESAAELDEWRKRDVRPATLGDLRHELFTIIDNTPWLDWQLLTKRPENVRRLWPSTPGVHATNPLDHYEDALASNWRPNVWLGTSISDQATANHHVYELLKQGDLSAVRFLSIEPLLGPIDLIMAIGEARRRLGTLNKRGTPNIGWAIVGGESGHHARPMHPNWVRSLRDQCVDAEIRFFFKQWGEWAPWQGRNLNDLPLDDPTKNVCLRLDGTISDNVAGGVLMARIGKGAAGHELDGRTWHEFPEVAHAGV